MDYIFFSLKIIYKSTKIRFFEKFPPRFGIKFCYIAVSLHSKRNMTYIALLLQVKQLVKWNE